MRSTIAQPAPSCQVYTPPDLAAGLVSALKPRRSQSWLEPSCGPGVFLDVLASRGVPRNGITAIDLDLVRDRSDRLAKIRRGVDFLHWAPRARKRFDRIVGNPPYLHIRDLPSPLLESAASTLDLDGGAIGKRANVWYSFVCASIRLLNPGGAIGFVLPAALEFADYARPLPHALAKKFSSVDILRCNQPMFDDVGEGSVVLIARGFKRGKSKPKRRAYGSRSSLIRGLGSPSKSHGSYSTVRKRRQEINSSRPLTEIMKIRIGGVTGDAKFFLLSEQKRKEWRIPTEACRPILTRASHLETAFIGKSEWEELRRSNERVWIFDPPPRLVSNRSVQEYMARGGANQNAHKISSRDPWFRTPLPGGAHGFISGMSRLGPVISLNTMPRLTASNTLYVANFVEGIVEEEHRPAWALVLLSTPVQQQVRGLVRRYPQGLLKLEPGDLCRLVLPEPKLHLDSATLYRRAVSALLSGQQAKAREIADQALAT